MMRPGIYNSSLRCLGRAALLGGTLLTLLLISPAHVLAAQASRGGSIRAPQVAGANIIRYSPAMRVSFLAGRPDTDLVEFANGRRMRVGDLRRLESWGQKARNTPQKQLPAALVVSPAATGMRLNDAAQLAAALKRPDNETVVLPSGRRATIGMIKLVQPRVEQRLGRSLSSAQQRPGLAGPAVKVSAATTRGEWQIILAKPETTVLESPNGMRITVGELRNKLRGAQSGRQRRGR